MAIGKKQGTEIRSLEGTLDAGGHWMGELLGGLFSTSCFVSLDKRLENTGQKARYSEGGNSGHGRHSIETQSTFSLNIGVVAVGCGVFAAKSRLNKVLGIFSIGCRVSHAAPRANGLLGETTGNTAQM